MKQKNFFLPLVRRYFVFINLLFLLAGLFCVFLADFNFRVEYSIDTWVEKNSSSWHLYQDLRNQFGDDETLLVVFKLKDLSPKRLDQYLQLTRTLQKSTGVKMLFDPVKLFLLTPHSQILDTHSITRLRQSLLHDPPDYRNVLVSKNLETIGLMILCHQNQSARYAEILHTVKQGMEDMGLPFRLAGTVYFSDTLTKAITTDLTTVIAELAIIALLGIAIFLWSWQLSLCVLMGIALNLLYTLAFATWLGIKLNLLSLIFFPLVFCMNLTTSIHLFSRRDSQGAWSLKQAYPSVCKPAFITMLATALGSAVFIFAPQTAISDMGIMLSFSIILSFFCSMLFVPSAYRSLAGSWNLSFLRPPHQITHKSTDPVTLISLVLITVATASFSTLPKLKTNPDAFYFFNQDSELVNSYQWIEDHLTGMLVIDMVIHTMDEHSLSTPGHLTQLKTFTATLQKQNELTTLLSGPKWMGFGLPGIIIPGLEKALVSKHEKTTRLVLRYRTTGQRTYAEIKKDLEKLWADADHKGLEMRITGLLPLILESQDELLQTQSKVFPVVLLIMSLVLLILLRSYWIVVLTLIANFIPLLIAAGVMVFFKISINSINLFVVSIILGVTVDNTIHLLYAWKEKRCFDSALTEVLPALWTTSLIVTLAFVALLLSGLAPVMEFGGLSIVIILSAYLCDRYLLPFLVSLQLPRR